MDPAVRVQHILWYVLRMHTVNGVAHILPRRDNQRETHQHHDCERVVQPEHRRVYGDVADFDQVLQAPEYVQHVAGGAGGGSVASSAVMALLVVLVVGHEPRTDGEFVQKRRVTFGGVCRHIKWSFTKG